MAIPKIIHYLWLSPEKTPAVEVCLKSWKNHFKGYEIKEWNRSNFPFEDFVWTKEAVSRRKWAFVTDFFRLWVLNKYGGIYLDADVTATKNFDAFLNCDMFIGTECNDQIAAHAIGAIKGHPFIGACLDYYKDRHFILPNGSNDMRPMPNIITKIFMQMYRYKGALVTFDGMPLKFKDLVIYPDTYFTINTNDGNNVCYHNGLGSWRDNDADNPILEDVINNYFWYKFNCFTIDRKFKGIKKIIYLLMPVWLIRFIMKRKIMLKNNIRVRTVKI